MLCACYEGHKEVVALLLDNARDTLDVNHATADGSTPLYTSCLFDSPECAALLLASGADVIHAGYSAGGTAALLAAASDSATVAVLGLDAVDNGGIAATASATLLVPGLGLVGEPSNCNSNNNDGTYLVGLAAEGTSLRVHDATHCSFEGPTDVLCTGLCGSSTGGQQQLIVQLATAFVAWQAGVDPSGADWVDGSGSQYQQLVASGQISAL